MTLTVAAGSASTFCEAFQRTVAERRTAVALRDHGVAEELTWAAYSDRVRSTAGALWAAGVRRHDTVGLMLSNRSEFTIVDMDLLHLGAIPWSIYNTSSPEQISYAITNAGSRVVVTEERFVARLSGLVGAVGLEQVLCIDGDAPSAQDLSELASSAAADTLDFDARWREVEADDVLTLIYTSGTTGPPKAVELTHGGMLSMLKSLTEVVGLSPGGRVLSYLPSAHVADRWTALYWPTLLGLTTTHVRDPSALPAALAEVVPTFFGSVPRIFEKMQSALEATFTDIEREAIRASAPDHAALEAVRRRLGLDQVEWLLVGAAPASAGTLDFFAALGLPLSEVWGMSETSGMLTLNPPGAERAGTVGVPMPGIEVKADPDGELVIRSPYVMRGYRGQPELTAQAIDADGRLHTGDVGVIDADGYVTITDRKKELIVNASGKNMSPVAIEAALKSAGPLIGQAAALGDRKPYVAALLVLDPPAAAAWARANDLPELALPELAVDARVLQAVASEVALANESLSQPEQIKRWVVLCTEWETDSAELTATMKLRRK
jgi:long-chain acyl-CoA synthetase